ncbi:MAG: hypothetical protein KAS32_10365 [Candidatus Peribacteraceae bacterium]|nr:hypothetical protein [Candidatus Peribacteraceae bacterium]
MSKVTYEFDLNEDEYELRLFQFADKMYFSLDIIYNIVRNELKHGDEELSDHIDRLLERIQEEAYIIHKLEE